MRGFINRLIVFFTLTYIFYAGYYCLKPRGCDPLLKTNEDLKKNFLISEEQNLIFQIYCHLVHREKFNSTA